MSDKEEEKEAEEVKALIRTVERDTAEYLMNVISSIINEQVQTTHALHKETGDYIIDAIKDQCKQKGWD